MDSLVCYGSDDDNETDRYEPKKPSAVPSGGHHGHHRRREDDVNYDDVNMDMSEDSGSESEPELPPADAPPKLSRDQRRPPENRHQDTKEPNNRSQEHREPSYRHHQDNREPNRNQDREANRQDTKDVNRQQDSRDANRQQESRDRRQDREVSSRHQDRDRDGDRRERERRDDRYRSERERERREGGSSRRGLLGDKPEERKETDNKVPSLLEVKPFGGEPPPAHSGKSYDARDAVSPRFLDNTRERRERGDRERERDRDSRDHRDRHSHRPDDRRSERGRGFEPRSRSRDRDDRSKSRGKAYPPPPEPHTSNERRGSPPSNDYRHTTSYKVNKKLEVMQKMGLQIKTPDGSMTTAEQLRRAAHEAPQTSAPTPAYYSANALSVNATKIMEQVQKRKLLWSNKNKREAEEAAKWSGTKFAQDQDGKQASKFMRLMGIKDQAAVKPEAPAKEVDPIKKQEELFQAMQQQYEVARAATHTMRGVGLGFQRGQF